MTVIGLVLAIPLGFLAFLIIAGKWLKHVRERYEAVEEINRQREAEVAETFKRHLERVGNGQR